MTHLRKGSNTILFLQEKLKTIYFKEVEALMKNVTGMEDHGVRIKMGLFGM